MRIRSNRLLVLGVLGAAAYYFYNETRKNPELVDSAKEHWSNIKGEANRMASEARYEADQFIDEVESQSNVSNEDSWENVDGVQDNRQATIDQAQMKAEDVAEDLEGSEREVRDEYYRPENMNR